MQNFFNAQDNCDENIVFAYHKQSVAGIYIGAGLGKPTVTSVLNALANRLETDSPVDNRIVAQLCGSGRQPERTFGISINTTGDLAAVQKMIWGWSNVVHGHQVLCRLFSLLSSF